MKLFKYLNKLIIFNFLNWFIKLLPILRLQSLTIDLLNKQRSKANKKSNEIQEIISTIKLNRKLIALDVGALGGFNVDCAFESKYNNFFKPILVEPNLIEAKKLHKKNVIVIDKGLWSKKCIKKLYFTNSKGGTSMYKPSKEGFKLYYNNDDYIKRFDIAKIIKIECTTINAALKNLNIKNLDYLKIDVEGAELEVLKGIGDYSPLLINVELLLASLYEDSPNWTETLNYIYKLGYMLCSWDKFGTHVTQSPIAMDMFFIPNFMTEKGKNLILSKQKEFIFLMLIFGQIKLLQLISNKLDFELDNIIKEIKDKFFY